MDKAGSINWFVSARAEPNFLTSSLRHPESPSKVAIRLIYRYKFF